MSLIDVHLASLVPSGHSFVRKDGHLSVYKTRDHSDAAACVMVHEVHHSTPLRTHLAGRLNLSFLPKRC